MLRVILFFLVLSPLTYAKDFKCSAISTDTQGVIYMQDMHRRFSYRLFFSDETIPELRPFSKSLHQIIAQAELINLNYMEPEQDCDLGEIFKIYYSKMNWVNYWNEDNLALDSMSISDVDLRKKSQDDSFKGSISIKIKTVKKFNEQIKRERNVTERKFDVECVAISSEETLDALHTFVNN